jgi:hypothetical protein
MKKPALILLAITIVASGGLSWGSSALAATGSSNLIDDYTFDNTRSMTINQINSWLNSFPSSCISPNSGFTAPDPTGYTPNYPHADGKYLYGGPVTAGQVVYDAASGHGLNPQVLITKLQNEEQLVDGSAGCSSTWRYTSAVGFACTDSDTFSHNYSYTGADPFADPSALPTSIYYRNGTPVNSIAGSCVNHNVYAGFSEQVVHAAWALSIWRHKSEGQTGWAATTGSWNHCDDINTCPANMNIPAGWACYSGLMTQGTLKRCPTDTNGVYYDGYATIDGRAIHMDNGATAALYVYTPHIQSFTSIFSNYFGSPFSNCTYPVGSNSVAYRLFNPNTNGTLLSTDPNEVCTATGQMGYLMDAALLFTSGSGSDSVYRLQKNGSYLYTVSTAERDVAINSYGYTLEGVAFNASTSYNASTSPMPVYRLSYPPTGQFYYTISSAEVDSLTQTMGYHLDGIAFYSQNSSGLPYPNDAYRLAWPAGGYLYTASKEESDNAVANYGYRYDGVAFETRLGFTVDNLPVYRLAGSKGYFYTINLGERKKAMTLGYRPEGVGYFAYQWDDQSATQPVYRLVWKDGTYFYAASSSEATSAANIGYRLEGVAFRIP